MGVTDVMTNVRLAGWGLLAAPAGTGSKTASPAAREQGTPVFL
jgi:hypothetical protein